LPLFPNCPQGASCNVIGLRKPPQFLNLQGLYLVIPTYYITLPKYPQTYNAGFAYCVNIEGISKLKKLNISDYILSTLQTCFKHACNIFQI
jgi:hypothetical protein